MLGASCTIFTFLPFLIGNLLQQLLLENNFWHKNYGCWKKSLMQGILFFSSNDIKKSYLKQETCEIPVSNQKSMKWTLKEKTTPKFVINILFVTSNHQFTNLRFFLVNIYSFLFCIEINRPLINIEGVPQNAFPSASIIKKIITQNFHQIIFMVWWHEQDTKKPGNI